MFSTEINKGWKPEVDIDDVKFGTGSDIRYGLFATYRRTFNWKIFAWKFIDTSNQN